MRQTVLFTTPHETIQVKKILFAGAVYEIDVDKRKNDNTHTFKFITATGTSWCYFKNLESAKKARSVLAVMMDHVHKNLFRSRGEVLDPKAIVSFGRITTLKESPTGATHGYYVTIETIQEKFNTLWFTFNCEDHAEKSQKALYACLMEANGVEKNNPIAEKPDRELVAEHVMA